MGNSSGGSSVDEEAADLRRLGAAIRRRRLERGWTGEQLGDAIGRTRQAISAYELGEKPPPITILKRIADALQQHVSVILLEAYPLPEDGLSEQELAMYSISKTNPRLARLVHDTVMELQRSLAERRAAQDRAPGDPHS